MRAWVNFGTFTMKKQGAYIHGSHVLLVWLLWLPGLAGAQAYNYPNGSLVDNFVVTDVNGNVHDLYDYTAQGKYVFLDFFTLGCPPCQETAPYWGELYQTYGCNSSDVVCLSLDYELNTAAAIQAYADAYCGEWAHPPVVTGALALTSLFGVGNAPNYCLIGPDNVMINNCIWPVATMADFVAALPVGSGIAPQACAVGMPELGATMHMAFPNPTHGTIALKGADVASVLVYDASGRPCANAPLIAGELDLRGKVPGLYVLALFNAGGLAVGRLRVILE
jgi:thiol-disulfide isomerase/thioredoxin